MCADDDTADVSRPLGFALLGVSSHEWPHSGPSLRVVRSWQATRVHPARTTSRDEGVSPISTPIWLLTPAWRGLVIMFALVAAVLLAYRGYTAAGTASVVGAISTLGCLFSDRPRWVVEKTRAK